MRNVPKNDLGLELKTPLNPKVLLTLKGLFRHQNRQKINQVNQKHILQKQAESQECGQTKNLKPCRKKNKLKKQSPEFWLFNDAKIGLKFPENYTPRREQDSPTLEGEQLQHRPQIPTKMCSNGRISQTTQLNLHKKSDPQVGKWQKCCWWNDPETDLKFQGNVAQNCNKNFEPSNNFTDRPKNSK